MTDSQPGTGSAEEILAAYLQRQGAGTAEGFDEFVSLHPGIADELRRLHKSWMSVAHAMKSLGDNRAPETQVLEPTFAGSFLHRPRTAQTAATPPSTHYSPGDRVGDFRLKRVIGEGGMGAVWEAEQESLDRIVALKLIRPDRVSERSINFFRREGRAAARLQHPGIVAVHGAGEADGVPYLAQELIEGECTLVDFLDRSRRLPELPDGYFDHVATFFAEMADAVHAAHEGGVIHRDLKPQNVLVTPDDHPKITDFGLARIEDEASLSVTGEFAGTYYYMSPEQLTGRRTGIDHRTDIFSLGIMLYEAVTLVRPFEGDTLQQIANKVMFDEPVDPRKVRSRVPRDLAVITQKCLEKDPGHRYESMGAVAADLRRHLADETILARPASPVHVARRWTRKHPALTTGAAIGVIALSVILFLLLRDLAKSRALAERGEEVLRLAAIQDLHRLEAQADTLWPVSPELRPQLEASIASGRELHGQLESHRKTLDSLRANTGIEVSAGVWEFENPTNKWWHDELDLLVGRLEALGDPGTGLLGAGIHPEFGWGLERRRLVAEQLIAEAELAADKWKTVAREIARDPRYDFEIEPQAGLVPLGRDPNSGLHEFWHVSSGKRPRRRPDGTLDFQDDSGVVLVLIPGGTFLMGAQSFDRAQERFDPLADPDEGPVFEREVAPFFLSKYELTQGQWQAFTNANPSQYQSATVPENFSRDGRPADLTNPVEQVSWFDCEQVLTRLGLQFPTEEQWEYAARAGTDTPWWTGAAKEAVADFANLGDAYAMQVGGIGHESWMDDGYVVHAPARAIPPNPWGLHAMLGNVREWCADVYFGSYEPETLAREPSADRVLRGANFNDQVGQSRASNRLGIKPEVKNYGVGVRPAYAVK